MAQPRTRREFIDYCLRKLGSPLTQINIEKSQIDDRVDEALHFFMDYHYAGSRHMYYKHQITEQNISDGFVQLPDEMINIVRIVEGSSSTTSSGMFSVQYQYMFNNITDISSFKVSDYYGAMMSISLIQEWLVGRPLVDYNRYDRKIYLNEGSTRFAPGKWLIIEAYERFDLENHASDIWSDRWLQNYATVLIKENYATNITKFSGVQLMGGIQFNAERILSDAVEERRRMEEQIMIDYPCVSGTYG